MAKKNHHYIPQTYLKQWEDSTKRVWLYNFIERTVSHRNKDSIFKEDYLYSLTFRELQLLSPQQREIFAEPLRPFHVFLGSNELTQQEIVENLQHYDEFIVRKKDGTIIKEKHKTALLNEMLNRKHPEIEDRYSKSVESSWNDVVNFFEKFRTMVITGNIILPEARQFAEYANKLLEFMLSIYTRNPYNMLRSIERVKKREHLEIDNITARTVFEKIQLLYLNGERKLFDTSKYDIHLFFTTTEYPFITTDNPVVIRGIEMEGAGFKGLFWFPISPYILISLSEKMKKNHIDIKYYQILGEMTKELNSLLIDNAIECFILPDKIEDIGFSFVQN